MKLETERLIIRELCHEDKEGLVRNINNLKVSENLALVPYPYTKKDAEWWINECITKSKENPRKEYELGIELKSEKSIIGSIALMLDKKNQGTAEIGYWLGEDYWKQGIMSEAFKAIIDFAFNSLKLRRVNLNAFAENKASCAVAEKFGFKFEGISRKGSVSKATGKIHDQKRFGLLREEWE